MTGIRLTQLLRVALRNFRRSRLQAALATLAALSGTGGIVVCSGYGAAGRAKIFDQFRRMGTNLVIVTPQQSRAVGGRARTGAIVTTLREGDYKAILRAVPAIAASSPTVATTLRLRANDLTKNTTVVGCLPDFFAIRSWRADKGALFSAVDDAREQRVALLGTTTARDLFGTGDPVGRRIILGSVPFIVWGVLAERGQGVDAANEDAQVYVPLKTAMRRLLNQDYFASILLEINSWEAMDAGAGDIASVLTGRHRFVLFGGPDFEVQNQKSLIETQLAAFARLTFYLRWIAASMVAVASLGIFGVAWIAVGNRRREIGTCRAIGATAGDMLAQYVAEGIAGPVLGCAIGIAAAWPALRIIDARVGQPFLFSPELAGYAFLASIALYTSATLATCWRTTRIRPYAALRSE